MARAQFVFLEKKEGGSCAAALWARAAELSIQKCCQRRPCRESHLGQPQSRGPRKIGGPPLLKIVRYCSRGPFAVAP